MSSPTNTYTVTFADAHSHTVQLTNVPGAGGNTIAGKADALRNVMNREGDQAANELSILTAGDTLTVTVTQP